MTSEDIKSAVKRAIVSVTGSVRDPGSISDSASYVQDLGLDSLAILEIAVEMEREFEIRVPEEELSSIQTIEDTVRVVLKYRAAAQPQADVVPTCADGLLSPASA